MKRFFLFFAFAALMATGCKPEARVMARAVPERADDFVFENNLIAGRFYGEALEGNPTSPGLDIWVKMPGKLVADNFYYGRPFLYGLWRLPKDCTELELRILPLQPDAPIYLPREAEKVAGEAVYKTEIVCEK